MAFQIPTVNDVWTQVRNAMRTWLPGTNAWIEPNNLSISGRVFSLALSSAYERVRYLYRQLFASTADAEHLEFRHAAEYGLTRKPAAAAGGAFTFTQTGTPATIPSGYTVTRGDGIVFAFLADAVPDTGGVATVAIRATTLGATTNTLPSTPLAFAADPAYPGLPAEGYVGPDGLGGGADVEDDEALRARVLLRKRQPPHGGARSDYVEWALATPGVTRAFVSAFRSIDPSEAHAPLTLYPIFDDTRANGVPTSGDLLAVANAIDPLRPVTSRLYVVAPNVVPIDVRIAGMVPDTADRRAAVEANLAALFRTRVPVSTVDNAFSLPLAWLDEAVSRVDGWQRHTIVSPAADVTFSPGDFPVLGRVFWGA